MLCWYPYWVSVVVYDSHTLLNGQRESKMTTLPLESLPEGASRAAGRRHRRRSRQQGSKHPNTSSVTAASATATTNTTTSPPTPPTATTAAVSSALEQMQRLDSILRANTACYDDDNDGRRRIALDYLENILAQWALTFVESSTLGPTSTATNTSSANNTTTAKSNVKPPSNPWQKPRVALITFGSFRLGVHRPTSDLDVLALAPPCCSRANFFTGLVKLLRADTAVKHVHPIATAYTPVVKFQLHGFHVDLLFGRASNPAKLLAFQASGVNPLVRLPAACTNGQRQQRLEYTIDDSDLLEQDEAGVRSLNGARVTQVLLELVPDLATYRVVLRAVKEWAVTVGIYSNVLGFLGGVNWAILVAWVCMRHPRAGSEILLVKFFHTFSLWKWPAPVALTPIVETPPAGVLPMACWNPQVYPRDGLHAMPIITPAYPSMNSSYNVDIPQLRRMQDEMTRAHNALTSANIDPIVLFQPCTFFRQHQHYLQLTIRAATAQDFVEWFRFCESRLRMLITDLETPDVNVWPFGRFYDRSYTTNGRSSGSGKSALPGSMQESCFFLALRFAPHLLSVNLRYQSHNFLHAVNGWENRKAKMDLSIAHLTADTLPAFVFEGDALADAKSDDLGDGGDGIDSAIAVVAVGENQSNVVVDLSPHPKRKSTT